MKMVYCGYVYVNTDCLIIIWIASKKIFCTVFVVLFIRSVLLFFIILLLPLALKQKTLTGTCYCISFKLSCSIEFTQVIKVQNFGKLRWVRDLLPTSLCPLRTSGSCCKTLLKFAGCYFNYKPLFYVFLHFNFFVNIPGMSTIEEDKYWKSMFVKVNMSFVMKINNNILLTQLSFMIILGGGIIMV